MEPHLFKPERFLTPDGKLNGDDQILAFGFGRRCAALCRLGFILLIAKN
jgi:cytochrome P450